MVTLLDEDMLTGSRAGDEVLIVLGDDGCLER